MGSVESPLPCLFWCLCAARLTLGSGPASPTTFSASPSPSVFCLQRSSSSSPRFRRSHRQAGVISLFKPQGLGNLHFTHGRVFYHLRFHGFPGRECEHLVSRHESATASPLHPAALVVCKAKCSSPTRGAGPATLWTAARQAALSTRFLGQKGACPGPVKGKVAQSRPPLCDPMEEFSRPQYWSG